MQGGMSVGMVGAFRSPLHPSGSPFADSVSKGDSEGFKKVSGKPFGALKGAIP